MKVLPSALVTSRTTTTKAKAIVAFRDITKTGDKIMFQLLFCVLAWTGVAHRSLGSMHTSNFSFYISAPLTLKFHILLASLQQIWS